MIFNQSFFPSPLPPSFLSFSLFSSGRSIVASLAKSSATYENKTTFAQQKYLRRKVSPSLPPSPPSLSFSHILLPLPPFLFFLLLLDEKICENCASFEAYCCYCGPILLFKGSSKNSWIEVTKGEREGREGREGEEEWCKGHEKTLY